MLLFVLTTVFGALIEQFLERRESNTYKLQLYISLVVLFVLLSVIYELIGAYTMEIGTPGWYKFISGIVNGFEKNTMLQGFSLVFLMIFNVYFNMTEKNVLPFDKYSQKIKDFTDRARNNSVIRIVAGDMDFFDKVEIRDTEIGHLMKENKEYEQLLTLYTKEHIRLQILCSHGLEKEQELFNAILNDTANPEHLYSRYRTQTGLTESSFQQLLRIGKIKTDFKNSVEIRFYNNNSPDKGLRHNHS